MKTNLKFIVASSPGHYRAAQHLLRSEGVEERQSLSFPTILAWDGDTLIGVCGTRIIDKMIVAGPLIVQSDRRRLFTIMRLCEAYDIAMSQIGITSYIIAAEHGSILQRAIERYFPDMKPYASEDGQDHYIWKVRGYEHKGQRTGTIAGGEGPSAQPS